MNHENIRGHMRSKCRTLAQVDPSTVRTWATRLVDERDRELLLLWLSPAPTGKIAERFGLTRGRVYQIVNRALRAIRYAHHQPNLTPAVQRFFTTADPAPSAPHP